MSWGRDSFFSVFNTSARKVDAKYLLGVGFSFYSARLHPYEQVWIYRRKCCPQRLMDTSRRRAHGCADPRGSQHVLPRSNQHRTSLIQAKRKLTCSKASLHGDLTKTGQRKFSDSILFNRFGCHLPSYGEHKIIPRPLLLGSSGFIDESAFGPLIIQYVSSTCFASKVRLLLVHGRLRHLHLTPTRWKLQRQLDVVCCRQRHAAGVVRFRRPCLVLGCLRLGCPAAPRRRQRWCPLPPVRQRKLARGQKYRHVDFLSWQRNVVLRGGSSNIVGRVGKVVSHSKGEKLANYECPSYE